jgi:NADH-quinone oxidoreductase subunit J
MELFAYPAQLILGCILLLASLGIILVEKPIHASLCFLLTLLCLAAIYLQLSAQFIAVMQVLVYAGAILVIFVFVIILFQDAHRQISQFAALSAPSLLLFAGTCFIIVMLSLGNLLFSKKSSTPILPVGFGTVESLGKTLYIDFFFSF